MLLRQWNILRLLKYFLSLVKYFLVCCCVWSVFVESDFSVSAATVWKLLSISMVGLLTHMNSDSVLCTWRTSASCWNSFQWNIFLTLLWRLLLSLCIQGWDGADWSKQDLGCDSDVERSLIQLVECWKWLLLLLSLSLLLSGVVVLVLILSVVVVVAGQVVVVVVVVLLIIWAVLQYWTLFSAGLSWHDLNTGDVNTASSQHRLSLTRTSGPDIGCALCDTLSICVALALTHTISKINKTCAEACHYYQSFIINDKYRVFIICGTCLQCIL